MSARKGHRFSNYRLTYQQSGKGKSKKKLWIDRSTDRHGLIIAILFFAGFFMTVIFAGKTLVTWITVSRFFALFAVIFSFLPRKFLPVIYRIRKELKIILALFGLAPLVTGLLFTINFSFASKTWTETYPVLKLGSYSNKEVIEVVLPEDQYQKFKHIRRFSTYGIYAFPDSVSFTLRHGVFGFKTVKDAHLIINPE